MFSCVTIAHTLPDGHQHLPPDARFTKHPKGMLFGHHPDMTAAQHHQLQAVIEAHDNAFSYSLSDLPGYHGPRPPLTIPLTTTEPVRSPPRRYSPIERQICSDKTAELLAAGIISPVEGPCSYAAAPVPPAKKDVHGNWTDKRFAIDYRQLNAATRPDIYGLPRPDELFSELGDSCYFSKLDMRSGFFQLHIAPADRIKTPFWCGNKLYYFNRMPFGLRNAPAEYQRVMDRCVADAGLIHCCKAYIDDLLVHSTTAILLHNHWWAGIHADVARVLRSCHVCDRARASFNLRAAQLSPLPVQGLFYRWGVDLAGPLPRTHRGHEHLTKHAELVPIPDRLASTTAYHFHHQVLGRFGASAEVLTDGGREFQGEFADLLQRHLIDHRVTSPHHPQADGLAERAVQTFKDALRKHIAVSGDPAAWDEALPAIALGYRASPQEATKCSPYSLLYGRAPVLPPAVVQRPINLDDPVVAAHDLLERSAVLSHETAAAMGNIRIAQHRDTLRYATTHSGSYKPAVRQLHPCSFVWTQRPQSNTLQLSARPEIYRVVSVGVNGVAKLQRKCGRVMAENVCNLAPCHLPDIDPTIDHTLARPAADFPCSICKSPTDAERMLLCDGCGKGFHTFCLTPKLTAVPEGSWLCAGCIGNGLTTQEVQRRTQDVAHQPQTSPLQEDQTRAGPSPCGPVVAWTCSPPAGHKPLGGGALQGPAVPPSLLCCRLGRWHHHR
ncbi:hypothetical protein QJQ45_008337 [Haematococcus lacustris]|nr:hypothetical protein QJQ45_008337 [Haematococcus lacustris]